jgi:hypothetical protein
MAEEFNPFQAILESCGDLNFPERIGDLENDYTSYPEEVTCFYSMETSKGLEELLILTISLTTENQRMRGERNLTTLRYDGRQIIKVIYTIQEKTTNKTKTIKQAFYRSTGLHVQSQSYIDASNNINTERTWVPFDGVGYHDEGYVVALKRDMDKNASIDKLINWAKRDTALYKCSYFGNKLAFDFAEPVNPKYPVRFEQNASDKEWNKNFDLVRYGDETTMRISFLLSSGDPEPPPFWTSPLGRRIIETYGFESINPDIYSAEDPDSKVIEYESEIKIDPSNFIEANERQVNNFVADYVSFNWQDNFRSLNYDETFSAIRARQNRDYDLRYSYMPTKKGTWVMFDTYLHTNPDSRLPMEAQSSESQKTKWLYDNYDCFDIKGYLDKLRLKEEERLREREEKKKEAPAPEPAPAPAPAPAQAHSRKLRSREEKKEEAPAPPPSRSRKRTTKK